ncbi:TIM-barrel domain-containing protein [Ancylothrix sp. D3o]|uniref:TIM-barrel domain-containing protein n=1 Tax=Ancylothrix sp. D3o TaxID=2953691 RepID=UPI0021BB3ADE|nr:TIM-barrel domain-containing protein [Ancylothrix sp. D3o]
MSILSSQSAYRFVTVEEFFAEYENWQKIERVISSSFNEGTKTLTLKFETTEQGKNPEMLIQFFQKDIFRVRFNPGKVAADYTSLNSPSVAHDRSEELANTLLSEKEENVKEIKIEYTDIDSKQAIVLTKVGFNSASPDEPDMTVFKDWMKVVVTYYPFQIEVFNYSDKFNFSSQQEFRVWQTAETGIYYTYHGVEKEDYAIIQAVSKPATAKYIGFGEQGSKGLYKNGTQVNFFNYDNMRYKQVYNIGPLDDREPLYHSDPFFLEVNGVSDSDKHSIYGLYIDNPAQVLVDISFLDSSRYIFGTRFGDLDYYFFLGDSCSDVIKGFTSIVGRCHLKPRYVLGYHQGCYGYENGGALKWAVDKYRQYNIPLDGLHVDVDIQNSYQTFTINDNFPKEPKEPNNVFSDAKEMFYYLRSKGVKCSTNITPIISNQAANYQTYKEGLEKGYFILDRRSDPNNPDGKQSHYYEGGSNQIKPLPDLENFNSGKPYIGQVYYGGDRGTTGHYPDLGRLDVRKWWGEQYKYLFEMGLEFVWQDMTTPAIAPWRGDMKGFPFRLLVTDDFFSDVQDAAEADSRKTPALKVWNLFSYNLHKATYHGLNNLPGRENKRNFIIGRGSFTGMHRFSGLWTGDNSSSWDFLRMNVSQVLSLGMCGMSICGQDIGGFEAEDGQHWVGPELLMRWTVAGAFLPWFRNHYIRKGQKDFQEPFMYEKWFEDYRGGNLPEPQDQYRMVLPICKYYIELRYRLLQLFYDAMFENTLNGMPICRPMFLNEPYDKALYNDKIAFLDNQFFVGQDLLIAPVLEPQSNLNSHGKRDVYLPAGSNWYCFMDNKKPLAPAVKGGTTVRFFDAHLDANPDHIGFIVPIYVRMGAVIPTIQVEQYVGELNAQGKPNPITINIYPGETNHQTDADLYKRLHKPRYTMYLDDGVSRSSAPTKNELGTPLYNCDEKAKDEYRQIVIEHYFDENDKKIRYITMTYVVNNYKPPLENYYFVALLHDPLELPKRDPSSNKRSSSPLKKVSLEDVKTKEKKEIRFIIEGKTPEERAKQLSESDTDAWYYNENIDISFIKVFDSSPSLGVMEEYFSINIIAEYCSEVTKALLNLWL